MSSLENMNDLLNIDSILHLSHEFLFFCFPITKCKAYNEAFTDVYCVYVGGSSLISFNEDASAHGLLVYLCCYLKCLCVLVYVVIVCMSDFHT